MGKLPWLSSVTGVVERGERLVMPAWELGWLGLTLVRLLLMPSPLLVVPVRMGLLSVLWRSVGESERRSMIANRCAGKAGPNP